MRRRRIDPALNLLLINGASGSGKTCLAQALAQRLRNLAWIHPDGMMDTPHMQADEILERSLCRAAAQGLVAEAVLDCQILPSAIEKVLHGHPIDCCQMILLDCPRSVRERRLLDRGWDRRDFARIHRWAEILRRESEAAGHRVFDSASESTESIAGKVEQAMCDGALAGPPVRRRR